VALVAFVKPYRIYGTIPSNQLMASIPEIKRPGREFDHAPPSSAQVKNEWSYVPSWRGQGQR